jgi:hypothetical protein
LGYIYKLFLEFGHIPFHVNFPTSIVLLLLIVDWVFVVESVGRLLFCFLSV